MIGECCDDAEAASSSLQLITRDQFAMLVTRLQKNYENEPKWNANDIATMFSFCRWNSTEFESLSTKTVTDMLCRIKSYREIQSQLQVLLVFFSLLINADMLSNIFAFLRVQVFFKMVPSELDKLLMALAPEHVTLKTFCAAVVNSNIVLSFTETYALSKLLSGRSASKYDAIVDYVRLDEIRKGHFISASFQ